MRNWFRAAFYRKPIKLSILSQRGRCWRVHVGLSRSYRPSNEGFVVLNGSGQQPEMNDLASGLPDDLDHLGHSRGILVTGDDDRGGLDQAWVSRLRRKVQM